MIFKYAGFDVTHSQFQHNGITYPMNWCQCASLEELAAVGVDVYTEITPTLEDGEVLTREYEDDPVAKTRTYLKGPVVIPVLSNDAMNITEGCSIPIKDLILFVDASSGDIDLNVCAATVGFNDVSGRAVRYTVRRVDDSIHSVWIICGDIRVVEIVPGGIVNVSTNGVNWYTI